jgi:hypothetical protein
MSIALVGLYHLKIKYKRSLYLQKIIFFSRKKRRLVIHNIFFLSILCVDCSHLTIELFFFISNISHL